MQEKIIEFLPGYFVDIEGKVYSTRRKAKMTELKGGVTTKNKNYKIEITTRCPHIKSKLKKEKIIMEKYFIVRGDRSGVFFGRIKEGNRQEVILADVRCLWYWDGAASIIQLAAEGTKKPTDCKFTMSVDELIITDAIEIIPCTDVAVKSIKGVKEWKA